MKSNRLALRVTLHSAVMILGLYLVIQSLGFFRDGILLGTRGLAGFFPSVMSFMAGRVVPPLLFFSLILFVLALPLQKTYTRLARGEKLAEEHIEKTRRRILRFSNVVLALNILGFFLGSVLELLLTGRLSEIFSFDRVVIHVSNIAGGIAFAAAQSSLNNLSFAPLRDLLGIREMAGRRHERSSMTRQLILTLALVVYSLSFFQYNNHDVLYFEQIERDAKGAVLSGSVAPDGLGTEYRRLLAERLPAFSSRIGVDVASLPLPWERADGYAVIEDKIFALFLVYLLLVALAMQFFVSYELRDQVKALAQRIRDVVAGGGDLRVRINLRAMDDIGELTELMNRLLDQFHSVTRRIGEAASQTRESAGAIDRVLLDSEGVSRKTGESVADLVADLETQAEESRGLALVLDSFREAVSGVNDAADAQRRVVGDTAAAMDEMARSIGAVVAMTERAGSLSGELAERGVSGGTAVNETRVAIGEIEAASRRVLEVLGSLTKIAANTNLLAMNAAIEAAHAGEHGLGFAVVADEVRSLAGTAASETKAIKELIATMTERIGKGVQRADTSGSVLERLVAGLSESAEISRDIAGAARAQTESTRSVGASLSEVVASCESIRRSMEEETRQTDRMAATLEAAMARLESLASNSRRQSDEVKALEESFMAVRKEVDKNLEAVDALTAEIGRFKV